MTTKTKLDGVDWEYAELTSLEMHTFSIDHEDEYTGEIPITDFVMRAGIDIDAMINWCKSANYNGKRDGQIAELQSLSASTRNKSDAA